MFWKSKGWVRFAGYAILVINNVLTIPALAPYAPAINIIGTIIGGMGHLNAATAPTQ